MTRTVKMVRRSERRRVRTPDMPTLLTSNSRPSTDQTAAGPPISITKSVRTPGHGESSRRWRRQTLPLAVSCIIVLSLQLRLAALTTISYYDSFDSSIYLFYVIQLMDKLYIILYNSSSMFLSQKLGQYLFLFDALVVETTIIMAIETFLVPQTSRPPVSRGEKQVEDCRFYA